MSQQSEHRQSAAKAFQEALNQLQETLESSNRNGKPVSADTANSSFSLPNSALPVSQELRQKPLTLEELEEAVADIEQYMQKKLGESSRVEG